MNYIRGFEVTSRCGKKPPAPKVVVAKIDIEQPESLAEFVQLLGGEGKVLALANAQFATNAKNAARGGANRSVSETKLRGMAVDVVMKDRDKMRQLLDVPEDKEDALREQLIAEEMQRLRDEHEAQKGSTSESESVGVEGGGDDDESGDDEE